MPILQFKVQSNYDEVVRLRQEIESLEDALKSFGPGTLDSTIRNMEARLAKARAQFASLTDEAIRSGESVEKGLRASVQKMQARSDVTVKIKGDATDFRKANEQVMRDIDQSLQKLQMYGTQMNGLFSRFAGLTGLSIAGMGAMEFAGQMRNIRGEFQQYEVAFETMLGSADKAGTLMSQLVDTAAKTPFDLSGVTNGAKQLLAYGVSAEDVNKKLVQLGDIAAGLSLSLGDLVYLYGTTITQGRMYTMDLRQFQGRGIPLAKELAKQFGVAESQVGSLVTAGKVTSKEFIKAIESMAGAGGQFGGLMNKQSKTITGQISNIGDAVDSMFNEMGKSSEGVINTALSGTAALVENWKEVGIVLGTVTAAYAGFKIGDILNDKAFGRQYEQTMKKLEELQRTAADFRLDDDIKRAVDGGKISVADATEYQDARNKLKEAGATGEDGREVKTLETLKQEAAQRVAVAEAMEMEAQRLAALNEEHSKEGAQSEPMKLDDDLSGFVSGGMVSQEQAEQLQMQRDASREIWENKMKELAAAEDEVAVSDELNNQAQEALKSARERKDKADEALEGLMRQKELQDEMENTGIEVDEDKVSSLDIEAAKREQAAAAAELQAASEDAETAAGMQNEAVARSQAVAQEAAAISQEQSAAAAGTNTAATNANTGARGANTGAVTKNTIATRLGAAMDKTAAGFKHLLSNATKSVTASVKGLGAAIMANPLGMLLTVVSSAIGLLMMFKDKTEDASEEMTRFGESAVKTKNNVNTLYAVLSSVSEESKTYKDALSELKKIAKDYGVTIDNEATKYEQLIKVRERLITLIEEEGRQRQIANNIASMQQDFDDATEGFKANIANSIVKASGNGEDVKKQAKMLANIIADSISSETGKALAGTWDDAQKELERVRADNNYINNAQVQQAVERAAAARKAMLDYYKSSASATASELGLDIRFNPYADAEMEKQTIALHDFSVGLDKYTKSLKESQDAQEKSKDKPVVDYGKMGLPDLVTKLKEAQSKVKELDKEKASPKADAAGIEKVGTVADKSKGKVDDLGKSKAAPSSDTSPVDAVAESAEGAKGKVDALDGSSASPKADKSDVDALTDSAVEAAAGLSLIDKLKIKPKIDLSFLRKGYDWVRDKMSGLGLNLPALSGGQADEETPGGDALSDAQKEVKDIRAAIEAQIKGANTRTKLNEVRKSVNGLLQEAEFGSEEEKYYKGLIKAIDKKNPDKNKSGDDPKQRAYDMARDEEREKKRVAEMQAKVEQDRRDLEIATMREGTEKEIAEIRNNAKKRRDALLKERQEEADRLKEFDRQQWVKKDPKKNKAYNWRQVTTDEEYLAMAGRNKGYDTSLSEIAFNESSDLEKAYNEELATMRDHLKEYGTFKQRQLAIEQEYNRKIAEARNEGERLTFEAEKRKALDGIEAEAITAQIDWYSVFDNVGIVMKGQLEPLYQQLQSYVQTDAFRSSGADNQKAVIDAMQKLRQQLGTGNTSWTELASSLTAYQAALDALRIATEEDTRVTAEMGVLMRNEDAARKALESARNDLAQGKGSQAQVDAAQAVYDQAHQAVQNFGATVDASAIAVQNAEKNVTSSGMLLQQSAISVTQPVSELTTFLQTSGIPQVGELFAAFDKLKGGIDGLKAIGKAAKDAKDGITNAGEDMGKLGKVMQSEGAKTIAQTLGKGGLIAQIISAILSILDILKDGIGPLISSIIDSILNAISGIIGNILSGELFKQIGESLVKGIGGIFKSITTMGGLFDWWGNGESDPELVKDVERLTLTNDALRRAVENLTEEMRDASIGEAKLKYEDALRKIAEREDNTQEMMAREGAAHKNGVLGIGDKQSSNHAINNAVSASEWARISDVVGRSVTSASDFWSLTSEQMAKVADELPALYAKIKQYADDGYKDAAQYMDEYIGYYEEVKQLREAYVESLTQVSLDSVKDEFKSVLGDMESSAEDFAESFERMMQQAVINAFVNELFADEIQKWYDTFTSAMESGGGLSAQEQAQLQSQWDTMTSEALKRRDELAKAMGWDTSAAQQASSRSIAGMSQDTGDAIEGRLTAMQIAVESIRACEQAQTVSLAQITADVLTMLNRDNGMDQHYENMELQIAKCYTELVTIGRNTGAIVKPIQEMRTYLNEMNQKI